MHMLVALLLLLLLPQSESAPPGDPEAGASSFRPVGVRCGFCYGNDAEGAYGPALAGGLELTWAQFKRKVRHPYGVMPGFNETQLPDRALADIWAFIRSLPPAPVAAEPPPWHWQRAPETAPLGQRLYIEFGCGQCHEPENKFPRTWLGEHAKEVDYEYFADLVYNHTDKHPRGTMPDFSRDRFPEIILREIYKWSEDIGMRASIRANITDTEVQGSQTVYRVNLVNQGVENVGLDVEDLTLFIRVPSGVQVVGGTGHGYTGVQPLATLGLEPALRTNPHPHDESGYAERPDPDLSGDVMVWKVPRLAVGDTLELSFTLAGAPIADADLISQIAGSTVHWMRPGRRPAGSPPVMVYRDLRIPDTGDHELVRVNGRR